MVSCSLGCLQESGAAGNEHKDSEGLTTLLSEQASVDGNQ